MKAVFPCCAIALSIGCVALVASSALADSAAGVDQAGLGIEASSSVPDEMGRDPLFDDDWDDDEEPLAGDPFESMNRAFFKFNRGFHRLLLRPMARGYRYVIPKAARAGVRRSLMNLNSPSIFVNDLLQLRFKDAGETLGRFVLNSSIGFGGIFDVGVEAGWEYHDADFGQTLAGVGVCSGPYLVLPLMGPNTVRDGVGDLVDVLFRPLTYLIGPASNIAIGGGVGFTELEARGAALNALELSSVDYYAVLRSAYLQSRAAQLDRQKRESR